jgi:hypothetical protein
MSNETQTQDTPTAVADQQPLFVAERNGVALNFYETPFKRTTEESGKKGLTYPAPDFDEVLEDLPKFIRWVGPKTILAMLAGKFKATCQLIFEAACKPKTDSAGTLVLDNDGETMHDYEQFDLEQFKKSIVELSVTTETKAELEERQRELVDKMMKVCLAFDKYQTKDAHKAAVLEVRGEIELIKNQIAKKKRTRKTEAQIPGEAVAA